MSNGKAGNIALLFGVPVNYEEFTLRVSSSDWLAKFNEPGNDQVALDGVLSARWENEYRPLVADPLCQLIDLAISLGVYVCTGATLQSVREATTSRGVVILFAHWKGPEILSDDFIQPAVVKDFIERVEAGRSSLEDSLRTRFNDLYGRADGAKKFTKWLNFFRPTKQRPTLRQILSEALANGPDEVIYPMGEIDHVLEAEVTRLARRRDSLDGIFNGLLRPGNRLELFDGLHSKEVFEETLWSGFGGILDLTTCTSTVLADYIIRCRKHRVRTVQFPAVQEFIWEAKCIGLALQLFLERDQSYQEARILATNIMKSAIAEYSVMEPL